jgi:hypothetical protein
MYIMFGKALLAEKPDGGRDRKLLFLSIKHTFRAQLTAERKDRCSGAEGEEGAARHLTHPQIFWGRKNL